MGFNDSEGKAGSFADQYNMRRESHLSSLQQKEEEMRQKFVIRVKEKESELKDAEKDVSYTILILKFCDITVHEGHGMWGWEGVDRFCLKN
jgi:hypothetical protein